MSMINMTKGNTFHQIGITLCIYYYEFFIWYTYSKRHVTNVKITKKNHKVFYWKVILLAILEKQRAKNGFFLLLLP